MNSTFTKIFICFFLFVFSAKQVNAQCLANETQIVISITTDNYPGETSWELIDQNGTGFMNASALTLSLTTYTWTICVPTSNCYSFTIFDSWCDGICCSWGSGSYNVTYGGAIVASGGSFGCSETTSGIGTCLPPSPVSFCDDFEPYTSGNYLAATSSNWTTWTQPYTASEDVQVTNTLSNSGTNSIFFNGSSSSGGPSDIVLPFSSSTPYTNGFFSFRSNFYVVNGAYFNFQAETTPGITWALDVGMHNGTINFGIYPGSWTSVYLSSTYPSNQWFELNIEVDLNSNLWEVFIDGVSQGSFANPTNQIASLDLYPLSGDQFYVDDVCYEYSTNPIIYGCTDPTATNYNPSATSDDGSCIYCSSLTTTTTVIDESPAGASNGSIDLTVSGSTCSTPPTFLWSNGATTEDISGLTAGTYTVTITDCGCTFTASATVNAISGPCGPDSTEIIITILTDDYPTETSWFLMDQYGGGWTNQPLTSANTTYTWTLCVLDSNCYTFTMLDTWGDGICCGWGNGSYNITYGGVVVASGGTFAYVQEHCDIGYCIPNCIISIPPNAIPEGEPCGIDANHGCDDNWKISNFTIQGVTDPWSWGYYTILGVSVGEGNPDLYIPMRQNNNFFYYSGYYLNTWYPNSFSMYAGVSTPPLEIPTQGLFTSPYVPGQTFSYEFDVWDDDQPSGFPISLYGNNDYIGSYTLPSFTTASTFSITTSGGPDGNAYVDYTTVAPLPLYTPLTNNNIVHGTFWAEDNFRDSDWYNFTLNDSSSFSLDAISETPFNIMLMDASGGCDNPLIIDSAFAYGCDTISIQQTLQPGTYWLLVLPTAYSCMDCTDSVDYLLNASWVVGCNLSNSISVIPANCVSPNGSINLTVNGGALPYTYLWSNGDTTQNLNNVPVGTYDVIINASNNCGDTISSIYVPDYPNPLSLTYTTVPESLTGSFDGSIDISVAGGIPFLTYNWSGPNSFSATTEDISALEAGMYYITVTDINGCSFSDSIEVVEYSIDVGVSAFISPTTSCNLDSTEQIIVQITNYNTLDATNFIVSFQYNGQTYTDSVTSVLAAGDSMIYTFNSTINASGSGTYSLSSFTSNVLDFVNSNDTSVINFTNYYHDFYSSDYEMGFEPNQDFSGWLIEDANNDSYTWTINQYTGFNQSYGAFYNYNFNGTTAADDWLISQCFEFEENQTYSLGFKYRAASAAFPEDMTINIGSIQQGSSLTTMLLQMNNIINIVYDSTQFTFSVPSSGTYYIGWHAVSNSNMWRIDLDDINISMSVPNIYGCTDTSALNYNALANVDDGSCVYCIYGCMDTTAFNYDSTATCPDLSCVSIMYGCTDPTAINYYPGANVDDGSCIYTLFGCTDPLAINYDPGALINDGSCIYPPGCMDSTAINYNPNAIVSDSSCIYPVYGCTDSTAINYDSLANTDDGSCIPYIYGCMDSLAINYYAFANADDGSCLYPVYGCTDSCNSCNYNPLATMDDGSCVYSIACMSTGCIDPLAMNYDPTACYDDSSCVYCVYGCMDPGALNFDSLVTCDDGSCTYATCGPITGVYIDNIIHDRVIFNWDDMNSSICQVDQIRFRYREVGTSSYSTKTMGVPVGSGCNTLNTSKLVLNLTPNTTYEYDFKIWYCNSSTVNWHAGGTFTTAVQCDNVTNVTATALSSSKVEVCWDSVSTYAFVRLKYRVDTAGSQYDNIGGMGVFSPLLCKQKNGLVANTNYRVIYRTWCSASGGPYRSPQWDGPVLFTTPSIIRSNYSETSKFEIYPNPTRGIFEIQFTNIYSEKTDLYIYNVLGDIIFELNSDKLFDKKKFDLTNKPKGIYTIELITDGVSYYKKLILQ